LIEQTISVELQQELSPRPSSRACVASDSATKYEVTYSADWVAELTTKYHLKLLGQ
jgi:hypothetical protein